MTHEEKMSVVCRDCGIIGIIWTAVNETVNCESYSNTELICSVTLFLSSETTVIYNKREEN